MIRWLLLAAMTALVACAKPTSRGEPRIAPGISFVIPPPDTLGSSVVAQQLITAHVRGETFVFESHLEISPVGLHLVAFDPIGRRALTIVWRDGTLSSEAAPFMPDRIRPENIVADIAITYWPEAAIRSALAPSGASLSVSAARRAIVASGREIITVDYDGPEATRWNGLVRYRNEGFGYDLEIQSVRTEP